MATTTWLGSHTCDFCHKEITDTLYDGKTYFGPWATMCLTCWIENGIGLGTGRGQKYEMHDGKFIKVEG